MISRSRLAALVAYLLSAPSAHAQEIRGFAPTYTNRAITTSANQNAVLTRIWAPGLDDGYVPQGLAVLGDVIFVSAYKSIDPKANSGPAASSALISPAAARRRRSISRPRASMLAAWLSRTSLAFGSSIPT